MGVSKVVIWRIFSALTIALLCVAAFEYCRALTDGELVYALDDSYIHLQIARNLAEHGVWGIRPNELAFGSSSPLWTCLLAATFKVIGFHEWVAGVYSTLSCCLVAMMLDLLLVERIRSHVVRYAIVVAMCLMLPVSTAAILGMEHALHALCLLGFLHMYLKRSDLGMAVFALVSVGVRYESLFLVLPLACVELLQKRYVAAIFSLFGAAVVPLVYGAFAMSNGGCFLPNSLMVKSALAMEASFFWKLMDVAWCGSVVNNPMVYYTGIAALLMALHPRLSWRFRLGLLSCAVAVFGHLVFAQTGWIYNVNRYEIYLFATVPIMLIVSILEVSSKDFDTPGERLASSGLRCGCLVFMSLLLFRSQDSGIRALRASLETYQTPMLAAKVLASIPPEHRGGIFLNDLGIIAERTDEPIADVCGLGDQLTFNLLRRSERTPENMMKVLQERGVRYAAIYPTMWTSMMLRHYAKKDPVAVAEGVKQSIWETGPLCLYAMTPEDEEFLAEHLRHLPFALPKGISFSIRSDL